MLNRAVAFSSRRIGLSFDANPEAICVVGEGKVGRHGCRLVAGQAADAMQHRLHQRRSRGSMRVAAAL
jgi:hypothetical protein